MPYPVPVRAVSPGAEEALAAYPRGTVHSVYDRTVNLLCGERLLASLTAASDEVHPFSVCTAAPSLEGFSPGDRYLFRDGCLSVGNALFLLADASRTDLKLLPVPDRSGLPGALQRLHPAAEEAAGRSALGFLLFPEHDSPLAPWGAQLEEFARAVIRGDIRRASSLGERLFGMGWGLTPSVDDLCTGLLAAVSCVRADGVLLPLAETAFGRTTLVSYNFLFYACRGFFTGTLRTLAYALLSGDGDAAQAAAGRLLSFGHSSGADMLIGLFFGLNLLWEDDIHG